MTKSKIEIDPRLSAFLSQQIEHLVREYENGNIAAFQGVVIYTNGKHHLFSISDPDCTPLSIGLLQILVTNLSVSLMQIERHENVDPRTLQ